ncbi:MAG: VOC family protein [Chloroflexota bacterium]
MNVIKTISATLFYVRDFEASVKFYRDVLGFPAHDGTEDFMAFTVGDKTLAILEINSVAKMISEEAVQPSITNAPPRFLMAVFLEDTDKAYEELVAKGVHFVKPPTTQPWGQRTAYFNDPDGNIWEISHFPKDETKSE